MRAIHELKINRIDKKLFKNCCKKIERKRIKNMIKIDKKIFIKWIEKIIKIIEK